VPLPPPPLPLLLLAVSESDESVLESDADEQLLIHIPFREVRALSAFLVVDGRGWGRGDRQAGGSRSTTVQLLVVACASLTRAHMLTSLPTVRR
jgi:hypothetical protein